MTLTDLTSFVETMATGTVDTGTTGAVPIPPVDRIAHFIERFSFIQEKSLYRLLALWVLQSYIYQDFEWCGLLFIHAPEKACGKTRLLEVLSLLVANPSPIEVKSTEANLFRTAKDHTQFLDEIDTWSNTSDLQSVLNSGAHRGGVVRRQQQTRTGEYQTVEFPVFAPRVAAGIGTKILPDTTRDRSFMVPMVKQLREERRERFRERRIRPEADAIRKDIEKWIAANRQQVLEIYDGPEPEYLLTFQDRTIDVAEPLAAILEVACPESRADFLEAIAVSRNETNKPAKEHRVLKELSRLASLNDPLIGNSSELAMMCQSGLEICDCDVSRTLRKYGFETQGLRMGNSVRYRYQLTAAALAETCRRFVPTENVVGSPEPESIGSRSGQP